MSSRSVARLSRPHPTDEISSAIAQAASHRLRESQYLDLRAVECSFENGRLALLGRVPSFYLVQMANSLVSQVPGVERIENRLEVIERQPR